MPDDFREKYHFPQGLTAREQVERRNWIGNGGLHSDVNNFRSLLPFMEFEDGKLRSIRLYPLRLDMHNGFPALADRQETQIIFAYLCERNKQFGTVIKINDNVIEVELQ